MALRIVVAEDSLLVREGIVRLLDRQPGIGSVDAVGDYEALLEAVENLDPDIVLTDIRMPPTGTDEGIRAAMHWQRTRPTLGVVVLSQYAEPSYALQLLEHGSDRRAYLLKERLSTPDQLVAAIREVATGGSVVDPDVIQTLVSDRIKSRQSPLRRLTPREAEVLSQIAQGKNNAGVAEALHLSERAVEKHINSLFAKLDLRESPDVHRRVMAVLLYLSEPDIAPSS